MAEIILAAIDQKRGASGNEMIIFQDSADISMAHQVQFDVRRTVRRSSMLSGAFRISVFVIALHWSMRTPFATVYVATASLRFVGQNV